MSTVGRSTDPELATGAWLRRDGRGRYYAPALAGDKIIVYGPDGRFISSFGEKGDGPGEFGTMLGVRGVGFGAADSLYIFSMPGRVSVFSGSYQYVRSFRLPVSDPMMPHVLNGGSLLFGARIATPGQIGERYHLADAEGRLLRSFGGDGPVIPGRPAPLAGPFVLSPDERNVWTNVSRRTSPTEVTTRIAQIPLDGTAKRTFEFVSVPWMSGTTSLDLSQGGRGRAASPVSRTAGSISVAWVDASGLVWLSGMVQVQSGATATSGGYERRLEVLDPSSGQILVSQVVERGYGALPGSDLAWSVETDSDGVVTHSIWKLELRRQ